MSQTTPFAGLTVPEPGEGVGVDGGGFLHRNPLVTDHLLRIGAQTHRHDAHDALEDPTVALAATVAPTGGALPAGITVYGAYTLIDAEGGETLPSPVAMVTLDDAEEPPDAPTALLETGLGGVLTVGAYSYVMTWLDAAGGETTPSEPVVVDREPGPASARIVLSDLTPPAGLTYRIYRAKDGDDDFDLLASGSGATFTDDGTTPLDCGTNPPTVNTTNSTSLVEFEIDAAIPDGAVAWRLYVSADGDFTSPALFGAAERALDALVVEVDRLELDVGAPPFIATAIAGAHQIDPETEILGFTWRAPVDTTGDLPTGSGVTNRDGDVRLVLADGSLHSWDGDSWEPLGGGGTSSWKGVVATWGALPASGNALGDTRLALDGGDGTVRVAVWADLGDPIGEVWQELRTRLAVSGDGGDSVNTRNVEFEGAVVAPQGDDGALVKITVPPPSQESGLFAWREFPLEAGFAHPALGSGVAHVCEFMVDTHGFLRFRGFFTGGASGATLEHVGTLPEPFWPAQDARVVAVRGDDTLTTVLLTANGEVWYDAHDAENNHMDGVEAHSALDLVNQPEGSSTLLPWPADPYYTYSGTWVDGPRAIYLQGAGFIENAPSGHDAYVEVPIPPGGTNSDGWSTGGLSLPLEIAYEVLTGPNASNTGTIVPTITWVVLSTSGPSLARVEFEIPPAASGGRVKLTFDVGFGESIFT